uniref:Uncharacterized protein n=1 Tax=Romanomermis culicivorax TaxID=13658 RepID=A0A915IMZ3_ROMCU
MEQSGTECNRHNVTERKGNFCSVRLNVTFGHFLENCSYPFRPKNVKRCARRITTDKIKAQLSFVQCQLFVYEVHPDESSSWPMRLSGRSDNDDDILEEIVCK